MATMAIEAGSREIHWPSVIRHYRLSKGLKQAALARDLNVTQTMVSRWEAGVSAPSLRIRVSLFDLIWSDTSSLSRDVWLDRIRRHPAIALVVDDRGLQVAASRGLLRSLQVMRTDIEMRYLHESFRGDFVDLFDALCASGLYEGRVASAESIDQLQFTGPDARLKRIYSHGLHRPVFMSHQTILWLASGAEVSREIARDVRKKLGRKMLIRRAV